MKYISFFFALLFCAFITSCGEDDYIQIDTLNADGDEFYCNQKVKVWLCLHSSDLWHTDYRWTCDGGTLTQPQGLNEMTWQAPNVPGTYTITCTAMIGGAQETRSRKMYVSSYYFDKFEKSSHSMSLQSGTTSSMKKESDGNQYLQVKVNSSTEVTRYVRHAFNDNELCVPFSTRMKLGFEENVPNTDSITVGTKSGQPTLEYRWNIRADESNSNSYINRIRLIWYPAPLAAGEVYPCAYDELGNKILSDEGTEDYNIHVEVQYTQAAGTKVTYHEYHKLNTMNTFVEGIHQTVSMSIDENENFLVHVAGQEALRSSIIRDIRTEQASQGGLYINNWELYIPNGDSGRNVPVLYVDDAYASNSGILE